MRSLLVDRERQRVCTLRLWSLIFLCLALLGGAIAAQGPVEPDVWDGPYLFDTPSIDETGRQNAEIAHAALIGKPGPHRGKIVLLRVGSQGSNPRGRLLWNPASPTSADSAGTIDDNQNVFCSAHSFDIDGDT